MMLRVVIRKNSTLYNVEETICFVREPKDHLTIAIHAWLKAFYNRENLLADVAHKIRKICH